MGLLGKVRRSRRFAAWLERQQHKAIGDQLLDRAWPASALVVGVMVAVASWLPGASSLFRMDPLRGASSLVPMLVAAVVVRFTLRPRFERTPDHYVVVVAGMLAVDFIPAALVAASHPPGSFVFVAMALFAAAYHGWAFRAGARDLWFHAGIGLCSFLAVPLAASGDSAAVLLVMGPACAGASYFAGQAGMSAYEADLERDRLREAVRAQVLAEVRSRNARLRELVVGLLGQGHDVGNTVTFASLELDHLELLTAQDGAIAAADLRAAILALRESMRRLSAQTTALRELGAAGVDERVTVDAAHVVRSVAARFSETHPRIALACELDGALPVRISGGEESLRRIFDNLLVNAVHGDGARGARKVRIAAERTPDMPLLKLVVEDDGPGFPAALLESPIRAFSTTKPNGTGLGLFTCERLAAASGGALVRGRAEKGGARVEVVLASAEAAEAAVVDAA